MLIGGNVVNRIAAIGMIIVAAFFLKYAYDHHWITPAMIVVIGFAAGLALLFGGSRFHRSGAEVFAQGLLGSGISILYLSGYATFAYQLVSQPIALGIMSVVTVISIVQALRYDSLVVCLLGLAGGFLTPLLIGGNGGGGTPNHFGLFAYIALLDAGLLAVALKKDSWAVIEPLALVATYVTFFVWSDHYYSRALFWTAVPFLTTVWLLFCAADLCRIAHSITTFSGLRAVIGVVNSLVFYTVLYFLMQHRFGASHQHQFRQWMAVATIMIGGVYFLSLLALLRTRTEDRSFVSRYALTAIALLAIATAFQFDGFLRVIFWSIEAAGLIGLGLRWSSRVMIVSGMGLFGAAVVWLVGQETTFAASVGTFVPIWNLRCLAFAVLALCLGVSAKLFAKSDVEEHDALSGVFQSAWWISILVLLGVETNDLFRKLIKLHPQQYAFYDYARYLSIGVVWSIYGLVISVSGLARRSTMLPYLGIATIGVGTVVVAGGGLMTAQTGAFLPLLNVRALGFGLLFAVMLAAQLIFGRRRETFDGADLVCDGVRMIISLLVLELVTVETWTFVTSLAEHSHSPLLAGPGEEFTRYLALAAVWVIYSLPVMWYGLRRASQALRAIGLCALGAGVATIAAQGFGFNPIEHFRLIANARCAAFAIAAVGLLIHYRMYAKRGEEFEWTGRLLGVLQVVMSLLIFELVTAETLDYFARIAAIGAPAKALVSSVNMRQMMLSVVWLIYSFLLISFGFITRAQTIRFVAFALIATAVLKVFLSDLSFLEPLYRIFSFAGLALILFATSYLYQRYRSVIMDGAEGS